MSKGTSVLRGMKLIASHVIILFEEYFSIDHFLWYLINTIYQDITYDKTFPLYVYFVAKHFYLE